MGVVEGYGEVMGCWVEFIYFFFKERSSGRKEDWRNVERF